MNNVIICVLFCFFHFFYCVTISREGQHRREIWWPSAAGRKEESTTRWPEEIEMYHKVVGGDYFFSPHHAVSPRLHAALLRWLMNAEAGQFVCQRAFLFV